MKDLVEKIHQWGVDRKIIGNGKLEAQWLKLLSEFGEMCDSLAKGKCPKDDIGDQFVVLVMISGINGYGRMLSHAENIDSLRGGYSPPSKYFYVYVSCLCESYSDYKLVDLYSGKCVTALSMLAEIHGLTLHECVEHAYNEIKDRKGYLNESGVFIKEEA